MMKPETAMRQASETVMDYFDACYKSINAAHPNASEDTKLECASRMALAASIDYATAVFSGNVNGYPGAVVKIQP